MNLSVITLLACAVCLLLEVAMWYCFELRRAGILFPRHVDQSFFGVFTKWRMRVLVGLHLLVMLIIVGSSFVWIW